MHIEPFVVGPDGVPTQVQPDGSVAQLFGDVQPEWVRLPPDLGGEKRRVIGPAEDGGWLLEGGIIVQPVDGGFVWLRAPETP